METEMSAKTKKKQQIVLDVHLTPEDFESLRKSLGFSMREMAEALSRSIDPKAKVIWSKQYYSGLIHGRFAITREMQAAFYNIAAVLDDVPSAIGGAVTVKVLAQPGQIVEGSLIPRGAISVRCARPGCSVMFVKTNPRQKYHDVECQRLHARDVRAEKRQRSSHGSAHSIGRKRGNT